MGVMSDAARKLVERAQRADDFPLWLPMMAPLGVALIGVYIVFAIVSQPDTPEQPETAATTLGQAEGQVLDAPAGAEPDGQEPLAIAVEAFRYMLTGDDSLLPDGVSPPDLPVLRTWPTLSPDISVVEYSREGAMVIVSLVASGPRGETEFIRLQVTGTGEDWIVSVW